MAQIGDSVGVGATSRGLGGAFDALSSELFLDPSFDNLTSRPVGSSPNEKNGLGALEAIPEGTDLVVIELGYNGGLTARSIDAAMNILEAKGAPAVSRVISLPGREVMPNRIRTFRKLRLDGRISQSLIGRVQVQMPRVTVGLPAMVYISRRPETPNSPDG